MTTVVDLLAELRGLGIELQPHRDALRFRPRAKVTPELLARLRDCKAELLAMLRTGNSGNGYTTPLKSEENRGSVAVASVASPETQDGEWGEI